MTMGAVTLFQGNTISPNFPTKPLEISRTILTHTQFCDVLANNFKQGVITTKSYLSLSHITTKTPYNLGTEIKGSMVLAIALDRYKLPCS